MIMTARLIFRSIRFESAGMISAVLGVAAAVGLLSWHLGLARTAIYSGHDAARKNAAPFTAWIGAPRGPEGPREASGARGESRSSDNVNGRDRATSEATMGRRLPLASRGGPGIPQSLIAAIESDADVAGTFQIASVNAVMDMRPGGRVLQGPPFCGNVALLPSTGIPFDCGEIDGRLPDENSPLYEVVVNEKMFDARVQKPELGSEIPYVLANGTVKVKIVGFFKMSMMVNVFPQMYANRAAMDAVVAASGLRGLKTTLLLVKMKDGADAADIGIVIDKLAETDPVAGRCPLYTVDAVADRFQTDTVKNLMNQMPMSLAIAVITASCLLTTVLMIGLSLRRRRIAVLRCAGMTRGGIARLIIGETLAMLIPGWLLGLGSAALLLQVFLSSEKAMNSDLPSVIHLGWQTPVYSAVLALVVGFFAVAIPVYSSVRVKPLEITGADITASRSISSWKAILSVVLLLPLPLIAMDLNIPNEIKSRLMLLVGLPCFIASLCLGMHPLMRFVEFVFLKPLGLLLNLDPRILERRLSRDPARAAGTVLTLSLGLGGFIAVHIWGGTLMSSFVPSPEWPDAIVSVLPNGFTSNQVDAVRKCSGVADRRVLTVECTQFPMEDVHAAAGGSTPESGVLLLFGTDPVEAFGENPLAPMKFVEGDSISASELMAKGDYCVIPKMLSNITGLHKGDTFRVNGRQLEVAGVIDLNWHMVTSRANVRTRFGGKNSPRGGQRGMPRTVGMAFVNERVVRDLTGNDDRSYFLWLNMSDELRGIDSLQAAVRLDEEIRVAVNDDGSSAIRVHHRDEVADGTLAHGNDILGAMARIPFWSLVVTSTGITVLLLASVRGSKREFEVMRAIGMTRGQLARLILGEAILVTLCALALSLICGILVGWSFTGLSNWLMSSGLDVKLVIPWRTISNGVFFAFGLCMLMALLPLSRLIRMVDRR